MVQSVMKGNYSPQYEVIYQNTPRVPIVNDDKLPALIKMNTQI